MTRLKAALDLIMTAAVATAAVLLVWRLNSPPSQVPRGKQEVPTVEEIAAVDLDASVAQATGSPSAAAVIVEFSDFQCPFCARHAAGAFQKIDNTFITAGQVLYIVKHFPLDAIHSSAVDAATAAECAGAQGAFWHMRQKLFTLRGSFINADWNGMASEAGVDSMSDFDQCIREPQSAHRRIQQDQADGARLGVSSTPTFFFGKRMADGRVRLTLRLRGAVPFDVFESGLKRLLAS